MKCSQLFKEGYTVLQVCNPKFFFLGRKGGLDTTKQAENQV
jgi:hypothetical protein